MSCILISWCAISRSAEADGDLALVPLLKETYQVAQFDLIIPFFSSGPEFDFLTWICFCFSFAAAFGFSSNTFSHSP